MVRKLLTIDLIVNIILHYFKKTVHSLVTITTNIRGAVLKSSETFEQNP